MLPGAIKNFLDSIFMPPISFLDMVIGYLSNISLIAGKGINLNQYLSFFSYLPASFQAVLNSIIASILFLSLLQIIKYIMRMYFVAKAAIKWW